MNYIISGHDAIRLAERDGVTLHKHADPVKGYRCGLSIPSAQEYVKVDPSLVYVMVEPSGWWDGEQFVRCIHGYHVSDYFRGDLDGHARSSAKYLGPDIHGVEPTWIDAA